jgi:penicillin-insensitive murein DD-endopeptidase
MRFTSWLLSSLAACGFAAAFAQKPPPTPAPAKPISALKTTAPSTCFGTPANGRLEGGVLLPHSGANFSAYVSLASTLGRTYVHSSVRQIVLRAYEQLQVTAPQKVFVYGETGRAKGGPFSPHRTHQNGLSVDFMVPVLRSGQSVALPTNITNKFGYDLEFDAEGKLGDMTIDFEALAEHLFQLHQAAREAGAGIELVIFDPQLQDRLFRTKRGPFLLSNVPFMARQAWVRHDEHYHVDFKVICKKGR